MGKENGNKVSNIELALIIGLLLIIIFGENLNLKNKKENNNSKDDNSNSNNNGEDDNSNSNNFRW